MLHYVCDSCGNYWQAYRLPDDGDGCPACQSPRLWEFDADKGSNARHHAAHIARGKASGLFRGARA
jgi:hypothetical protein